MLRCHRYRHNWRYKTELNERMRKKRCRDNNKEKVAGNSRKTKANRRAATKETGDDYKDRESRQIHNADDD